MDAGYPVGYNGNGRANGSAPRRKEQTIVSSESPSSPDHFEVRPVGRVRSPLTDRAGAPRQADEDAPPADIILAPEFAAAAADLHPGMRVILLTWLHAGSRDTLAVYPRGDRTRPPTGVFATRSPDRPNPIGLHEVTLTAVGPEVLGVAGLEAMDGTPILDIKPVLGSIESR
ncbi:tRNA (N6-threonylcarbamoyladenosine(37)-N6)-methyltransferase TrmO [Nocardia niigatensis]|uniref:tRNA (N6-threonylcarbamoyladenosine(37)-N6)-methyltransferase TrmO n=1 Tax=Nocardia niigatensis TaxID=209249 RepID=UPI000A305030|nr:tRNA (N6-threonylcarbamoyladenosine(37)-N6)-methyltransferase TrmO [Nocardia niigatensis]